MKSVTYRRLIPATIATLLSSGLMGCEHIAREDHGIEAGWTLFEPTQRHPIVVSEQPTSIKLRIARGAAGLAPHQRSEVYQFVSRYKNASGSNSKMVVSVPSGSPNEVAAMQAAADLRTIIAGAGFQEASIQIEPYYTDSDPQPPIRVSYMRYVAEGPNCGKWPQNLAADYRNLPMDNMGCAQQRNLAAMIVNPADLVTPRAMTSVETERRAVMLDKYKKGEPTESANAKESATVKGSR